MEKTEDLEKIWENFWRHLEQSQIDLVYLVKILSGMGFQEKSHHIRLEESKPEVLLSRR